MADQNLFALIPHPVFLTDANGKIIYRNHHAEQSVELNWEQLPQILVQYVQGVQFEGAFCLCHSYESFRVQIDRLGKVWQIIFLPGPYALNPTMLPGFFEHLPLGVKVFDPQGVFVRMNQFQQLQLGLPSPDFMQGEYNLLKDDFAWEVGLAQSFEAVIKTQKPQRGLLDIDFDSPRNPWPTAPGKRSFEHVFFPVLNLRGQVHQLVLILWDVSEVQILNLALEQAHQALQSAEWVRDNFLANMSHELRTPLNVILGFSHVLLQRELNAAKRSSYLERIHENARHLLKLIEDLLEISKVKHQQLPLQEQSVHLAEMIDAILFDLNQVYSAHQNKALFLPPKELGPIYADALRLKQILFNLLSNAFKFTQKGEIKVQTQLNKQELWIEVCDTGAGISDEEQVFVFERFRQARNTTSHPGLGLGLALSQDLAHLMGGEISCKSQLGEGSCFTLKLPYKSPV